LTEYIFWTTLDLQYLFTFSIVEFSSQEMLDKTDFEFTESEKHMHSMLNPSKKYSTFFVEKIVYGHLKI